MTSSVVTSDADTWLNQNGGTWAVATNWTDITLGTAATAAPGAANSATITGGTGGHFVNIAGPGAAAQLAINNDVLLWGTLQIGGTVALGAAADLALDGAATLTAGSLTLANEASLEAGGASTLKVAGGATLQAGFLAAFDGSTVQVGTLVANAGNSGYAIAPSIIAVDANSALEVGTTGAAALGAITIDHGFSAAVNGTIDGNMALNGALGVQAFGSLAIDIADPFGSGQTIAGSGTLTLSENSVLALGVADSAAIRFGGPAGTLDLDVLPTGTITGFAVGDVIETTDHGIALATGVTYMQTSTSVATLYLTKGGAIVGTLTLAGNFAGELFHLNLDALGDGMIALQAIGSAPAQSNLILGTAGFETLVATMNNQTLTGLGGDDILSASTFAAVDFKDTSADLNGSTITAFGTSDIIDLTDMKLATASVSYSAGAATLIVTDGTHAAAIGLSLGTGLAAGYFTIGTDGVAGTDVKYTAVNADAYTFTAVPGGNYATASKWEDVTSGTTAALAPSYGNAVTIAGGGGTGYIDVTGSGFAASVATSGSVLIWGTLTAGSKVAGVTGALSQTGTLALDGAANVVLAGSASIGGLLEIGGGSTLTAAGGLQIAGNGASVLVTDGGAARFASVLPALVWSGGTQYATSVIAMDATSVIEIGSAGTAAAGGLTIDSGVTAELCGTIDGSVMVNGTLAVAGTLAIAAFGGAPASVSGAGTIALTFGDTLSLFEADSAAILFSQASGGNYGGNTETLALGTIVPTGTITGFTSGDVITLGRIVTAVSYNSGVLTLLNGAAVIGTLALSGTYAASQFQVLTSATGQTSAIAYAAAPGLAGGSQVSGLTDAYAWTNAGGGAWSNAANWADTTAGGPATTAPGAGDAVTIGDTTPAWAAQIIAGAGSAASLTITGAADTIITGTIAVAGLFSVNTAGLSAGGVALAGGANLTAGSLNVTSPFQLSGASSLLVFGSANGTFISGGMTVAGGSTVKVAGGTSVVTGTIAVDSTSNFEFGTTGGTAAGSVTIDAGQAPTFQGVATIAAAKLVVNGSLLVYTGTIEGFGNSAGAITGSGTITIGALGPSGSLTLDAADSVAIAFTPYTVNGVPYAYETLQLNGPLPAGAISGFVAGDIIQLDQTVTGALFTQTSATQGTLRLTDGALAVGTLTLSGNYTGSLFLADVAAATGYATIAVQAATSAAGTAPASTGTHAYAWTGVSGGNWTNAANWRDLTTSTPPTAVPGSADPVTLAGSAGTGQYTTIGGNGAAASLTISGNVLLTGQVSVGGRVLVAPASGAPASLVLDAGARLTAAASASVAGRMALEGSSVATITGNVILAGGSLLALGGSTVQAGGLLGGGPGDVIAVDANSFVKIGVVTTASAGTLTQSAAASAAFSGSIYASVVANGIVSVTDGATLFIDMSGSAEADPYAAAPTISGTGILSINEGSTLGLGVVDSVAIQFAGPNATLALAAIPTATITGFVAGDTIQIDQPVDGLIYKQVTTTSATLTLTDGANTAGTLKLAGSYGSGINTFHLDAAASGETAVITLQSLLIAPTQPTLIQGTPGADLLTATANGQTMTGFGGGDTYNGGSFTGIDFKDLTANLAGCAIQGFATSDLIDFTDMKYASATETYANGILSVTDGTRAASLTVGFASPPATGSFHTASDGASGTKLTWS